MDGFSDIGMNIGADIASGGSAGVGIGAATSAVGMTAAPWLAASQAVGAIGSGVTDYLYGKSLTKHMAPIYGQQSTAAMLQAVIEQKNYLDSIARRKKLMTDVEMARSPAALMERARKMEGYGDEARRLLAQAKASGSENAVLDAVRAARAGAERKQVLSLERAGQEAELDVADLLKGYEESEIEAANKARIQAMLFALFGQQLESKKYQVGADVAHRYQPLQTAFSMLG